MWFLFFIFFFLFSFSFSSGFHQENEDHEGKASQETIKTIGYLKPERVLRSNASDRYIHNSSPKSTFQFHCQSSLTPIQVHQDPKKNVQGRIQDQEAEIIDVSEL